MFIVTEYAALRDLFCLFLRDSFTQGLLYLKGRANSDGKLK